MGESEKVIWVQELVMNNMVEKESKKTSIVDGSKFQNEVMRAQYNILELIALGKPQLDVLTEIMDQSNKLFHNLFCSIFLFDAENNQFISGTMPELPNCCINQMIIDQQALKKSPFHNHDLLKDSVIISDISLSTSLTSECKNALELAYMKSSWFFPILSSDKEILGLYLLFSHESVTPSVDAREIIGTFVNLTAVAIERKKAEREIRKLAYYDPLTGLFNRRCFIDKCDQKIKEALSNNHKLGLLFLDLDRFKWINDSLGHDYGDSVLIEVANRLLPLIERGVLVSRFGGDEFVLLITNMDCKEDMNTIIQDMLFSFKEPMYLDHHEIQINLSIGVSLFPDHGTTINELLRKADSAMYQSKFEGRSKYKVYEPSFDKGKEKKLFLKLEMEKALSENQFTLWYQPIIDLKNGHIRSLEALIRWNHPQKGVIYPNEFISLSEESGFIVNLGEWVMQEACRQNKAWQDEGISPLRVAVNVSTKQIQDDCFVDKVQSILSNTGLAPEWLEIEITESALMDEIKMISVLQKLRQMGLYISIDDFGTGYSSLNYLKNFPVHALKVDRSFINYIPANHNDVLITRMITDLAHNLHLEIIAEGVENENQEKFLIQNGCELAQGYLYYHPLSSDEIKKILHHQLEN
jgi:diguanylate cyclase (GGDEF)-like protein